MIWKEKHEVVITRHLRPYALRIEVWAEDVELAMALNNFLASAVNEMENLPLLRPSKEDLLERLKEASVIVCEKMKMDIVQVVTSGDQNGNQNAAVGRGVKGR